MVPERFPAERVGDGDQVARDVVRGPGGEPVGLCRAVAGDSADRATQRVDLDARRGVPVGAVGGRRVAVGAARVVVGVVRVGLPRRRREHVGRAEVGRDPENDTLLAAVGVQRPYDLPARVVEDASRAARAGRRAAERSRSRRRRTARTSAPPGPCCRRPASRRRSRCPGRRRTRVRPVVSPSRRQVSRSAGRRRRRPGRRTGCPRPARGSASARPNPSEYSTETITSSSCPAGTSASVSWCTRRMLTDGRRLAACCEGEQVVGHLDARRCLVALAVLAPQEVRGDQPGRGERHRGGVAVDVGHRARLQHPVVVVRHGRQPGSVRGPDRQQIVLVVVDLALRAERVERGDRQPARHPARHLDVVAVPCRGDVVPARRPGYLAVAVVDVPSQRRQQVAELLRVLRWPVGYPVRGEEDWARARPRADRRRRTARRGSRR